MGTIPITLTSLRLLIAGTFVVQIGLLAAAPIPSPVATRRMVPWRRSSKGFSAKDRLAADSPAALLPPLAALAGLGLVLGAVFSTGVVDAMVPLATRSPSWLAPAGAVALLAGNGLVTAAALTLKRRTTFGPDGQSAALVTGGIFGLVRHPITLGMGVIYLGFFLALPSPWMLVGLLAFAGHQRRRLAAEEALLAERFGPSYRDYRRRVGGLWPRWPGGPGV
jgi:protein-S-isoprenylcysteine O-methyltransferase Ste14